MDLTAEIRERAWIQCRFAHVLHVVVQCRWWAERLALHPAVGSSLQALRVAGDFPVSPLWLSSVGHHAALFGLRLAPLVALPGVWLAVVGLADPRAQAAVRRAAVAPAFAALLGYPALAGAFDASGEAGQHALRVVARCLLLRPRRGAQPRNDEEGIEAIDVEARSRFSAEFQIPPARWASQPRVTAKSGWITFSAGRSTERRAQLQDPRAVGAGGGGSPAAAAEGARVEAPEDRGRPRGALVAIGGFPSRSWPDRMPWQEWAAGSAGAAAAEGRGAAGPAGAARELTITVPEGALPGTELCGRAPDGSEMCVEVPEGALPGSVLAVSRDPATGAWRSESRQRPDAGGSPSEAAGRSPAADAGGPVTVRLAVPAGATAGCKVDFTTPEGVELCMVVPDGVRQGAELVLTRASADAPWQCEVGSPGPAPPETPPAQPASPQPASPQRPQAPGTLLQRLAAAAAAAPGGGPSPEGAAATSPVGLGPAFSFAAAAAGEPAPAPSAPLQLAAASGVSVGSPPAAALEVEVSLLGPRRAPRGAEVDAAPPHRQPGSPAGQQQNWAQAAQERSPIPRHASEDFDDCCDDMDEGVHAGPSIADQLGAFSRTTAVGAKARSSSRPPSPPRPGGHGPACGEARCRPASPSRPACPPPPPSPPPLDFPDLGAPRDALGQEAPYVPPSSRHELHLDGQVPSSGSYVPPPWAQSQPLEQRRSYVPPPAASAHFAPLPQIPHGAQVPAPPELGRSLSPPLQRPGAGASHSPPAFASGIGTYPAAGPFQHGPSISTLPGQDGAHAGGQEQQGPWPPPQALPNPLMAGLQELKVPGLRPLAVPQIFPAPCAAAPLGSLPLVPPGVGGMPGPGPVPFGAPRPHLLGSAYGPPPPLQGQPPTHLYAPVHPAHGAMHGFPVPGYR
ncbi:unnamed protein product [Prorocentrum cordatum]|uniref:Uncharacterized protein n=1 Tax=Prorocentrum cordatum TaxID=2364126 RepID=A0ABN9YB13_9DINO|nr:unnamed protein product [Polarella glacialis]